MFIPHVEWRGRSEGFNDGLGEFESLEEYLMLFWPLDMMRKIVRMTNLYAGRSNGQNGTLGGPERVYFDRVGIKILVCNCNFHGS